MGDYRLISADEHIFELSDMWTTRVEPRFKDRAPRIEKMEDGGDWWVTDGQRGISVASGVNTGKRFDGMEHLGIVAQLENVRPGAYDPEERLKDMDLDGIEASIMYPNQGLMLYALPDTELVHALMQTYNDWLAEYCKVAPNRLMGIAMVILDDIEWAMSELERSQKMGLVGAMIPVYPVPNRPYHLPQYEPFWAAAQDLGIPLSLHTGTIRPGSVSELADISTLTPEFYSNVDHWVRLSLSGMILGGVFEKFPNLSIGSVENDATWAIYFLDAMDYTYTQKYRLPHWHRYKEDMLPSDYFHRNAWVSFQDDAKGIKNREDIGVANLVWGSDYPHSESTFPRSRQFLEEMMADCTQEEKAKIAGGNAARIYSLD